MTNRRASDNAAAPRNATTDPGVNPFEDEDDMEFGTDYGPKYPYVVVPPGASVKLCVIDKEPCQRYWSHPTDMDARRVYDEERGKTLGYQRHDVYLVYVDGANGNGQPCRTEGAPENVAKLDVKGKLWVALKDTKGIKPGVFFSLARTGKGRQTEYAIAILPGGPRKEAHDALLQHRNIAPETPF